MSLWEAAIKASLGRVDFKVDPLALRRGLLREGFQELQIQVDHRLAERHQVVQASQEGLRLLAAERTLEGYGEAVRSRALLP